MVASLRPVRDTRCRFVPAVGDCSIDNNLVSSRLFQCKIMNFPSVINKNFVERYQGVCVNFIFLIESSSDGLSIHG